MSNWPFPSQSVVPAARPAAPARPVSTPLIAAARELLDAMAAHETAVMDSIRSFGAHGKLMDSIRAEQRVTKAREALAKVLP